MHRIDKAYKEDLIKKARERNGFPVVTEIETGDVYLSHGEMFDVLYAIFSEQIADPQLSEEHRELFINSFCFQVLRDGWLTNPDEVMPDSIYDLAAYHPFIDRNEGVVMAKIETIIAASYDLVNNQQATWIKKWLAAIFMPLNKNLEVEEHLGDESCVCGADLWNFEDCCKIHIESAAKIGDLAAVPNLINEFMTKTIQKKGKDEWIAAEYLDTIHYILSAVQLSTDIPRNRKAIISKIAQEAVEFVAHTFSYEKIRLEILVKYLELIKYSLDLKISHKMVERKWGVTTAAVGRMFEQPVNPIDEGIFDGLDSKSIERIKTIEFFTKSLAQSDFTDYSLLSLGLIAILERELNEIRRIILGDENLKPKVLKQLFEFFKGEDNFETTPTLLPLLYSLRKIREKRLEDIVRKVRNEAAHGEISDHTAEEFELVLNICIGKNGLFKAISFTKMNLRNQVVLDKENILSYLVRKVADRGFRKVLDSDNSKNQENGSLGTKRKIVIKLRVPKN